MQLIELVLQDLFQEQLYEHKIPLIWITLHQTGAKLSNIPDCEMVSIVT